MCCWGITPIDLREDDVEGTGDAAMTAAAASLWSANWSSGIRTGGGKGRFAAKWSGDAARDIVRTSNTQIFNLTTTEF